MHKKNINLHAFKRKKKTIQLFFEPFSSKSKKNVYDLVNFLPLPFFKLIFFFLPCSRDCRITFRFIRSMLINLWTWMKLRMVTDGFRLSFYSSLPMLGYLIAFWAFLTEFLGNSASHRGWSLDCVTREVRTLRVFILLQKLLLVNKNKCRLNVWRVAGWTGNHGSVNSRDKLNKSTPGTGREICLWNIIEPRIKHKLLHKTSWKYKLN